MSGGQFKILNTSGEDVSIRLVKTKQSYAAFNSVAPANAVNTKTELSFGLSGVSTADNRIILAHAATPKLVNPSRYSVMAKQLTLTNGSLSGTVNADSTDLDYTTKLFGIFFKVTPADYLYELDRKSTDPAVYRAGTGSVLTQYTLANIVATKGRYFSDNNYYIPLWLGSLKLLKAQIGASTTLTPYYGIYQPRIRVTPVINEILAVTGINITNTDNMQHQLRVCCLVLVTTRLHIFQTRLNRYWWVFLSGMCRLQRQQRI
ncbi:MAG: hypothetical protein [Bacteriophage sp.]|nr:MAG: hypothetical protein [Bacteriophage sp.]